MYFLLLTKWQLMRTSSTKIVKLRFSSFQNSKISTSGLPEKLIRFNIYFDVKKSGRNSATFLHNC